jgi:hypothetical protein
MSTNSKIVRSLLAMMLLSIGVYSQGTKDIKGAKDTR